MPCNPPTMVVSIVGHASFHTAGSSGPSTIERSYGRRCGRAPDIGADSMGAVAAAGATTSVNPRTVPRASNHRIDAPRTRTSEHEVQEDEAVEYGRRAHVRRRPKRSRIMALKVGHCHFSGEHKRQGAREQA